MTLSLLTTEVPHGARRKSCVILSSRDYHEGHSDGSITVGISLEDILDVQAQECFRNMRWCLKKRGTIDAKRQAQAAARKEGGWERCCGKGSRGRKSMNIGSMFFVFLSPKNASICVKWETHSHLPQEQMGELNIVS